MRSVATNDMDPTSFLVERKVKDAVVDLDYVRQMLSDPRKDDSSYSCVLFLLFPDNTTRCCSDVYE